MHSAPDLTHSIPSPLLKETYKIARQPTFSHNRNEQLWKERKLSKLFGNKTLSGPSVKKGGGSLCHTDKIECSRLLSNRCRLPSDRLRLRASHRRVSPNGVPSIIPVLKRGVWGHHPEGQPFLLK